LGLIPPHTEITSGKILLGQNRGGTASLPVTDQPGTLCHKTVANKELSTFSVGCSLGAASWQSGVDVPSLYEAADSHLYARKKAGKASPNE